MTGRIEDRIMRFLGRFRHREPAPVPPVEDVAERAARQRNAETAMHQIREAQTVARMVADSEVRRLTGGRNPWGG
jgi:hypothetical protein